MGNMDNPLVKGYKATVGALNRNRAIRFVAIFVVSAFILLFFKFPARIYSSAMASVSQSYLNSTVNAKPEYKRFVKVLKAPDGDFAYEFEIRMLDVPTSDGGVAASVITTDFRREGYVPLALLLALFIALPGAARSKALKILFGLLIVNIYIFVKLYVFVFDNYNSPGIIPVKLPALIDGFVYAASAFLNATGFGTTMVVPVIVWAALSTNNILDLFHNEIKKT